ncbi:MAG: type II toxin-antitoxin system HicA family toxin [Thermacetogeniaceae bacterium]
MNRLARLTGKELLAALRRAGFDVVRITGSHYHLYKPGADLVTIPLHAGEIIKPKTLKSVLDQAGMTVDELGALL